jgi:hypothetical protein
MEQSAAKWVAASKSIAATPKQENLYYLDFRRTHCSSTRFLERGRDASWPQMWRLIMSVKVESRDRAAQRRAVTTSDAIREFHVNVPESELNELRRRINATRWPERETVADDSQGVQLATIQGLARYWGKDYDWRKVEARLNALPQFVTETFAQASDHSAMRAEDFGVPRLARADPLA